MKTGLHFEFFVSAVLERHDFFVQAEVPFSHTNPAGETIERSVDFEATYYVMPLEDEEIHGEIDLLVECKSSPGSKWLVAPFTATYDDTEPPRPILTTIDEFAPWRFDTAALHRTAFPVCIRGETLSEAADQIKTGLHQLRFAGVTRFDTSLTYAELSEARVPFYRAVFVTDAELFVLGEDLTDVRFRQAKHNGTTRARVSA